MIYLCCTQIHEPTFVPGPARYYRIFAGVALSFLGNDAAAKTKLDRISAMMAYTRAETALVAKDDHCAVSTSPACT